MRITERGWAGHFICADRCLFKRNTLIEAENDSVVVSTVGAMRRSDGKGFEVIGSSGRYYETMVFGSEDSNGYIEANVSDERSFESEWAICADNYNNLPSDVDNKADAMHNSVVDEFKNKLKAIEVIE